MYVNLLILISFGFRPSLENIYFMIVYISTFIIYYIVFKG